MSRAKRDDERAERLGHLGIERGRGLVEQKDGRIVHESASDGHLLAHAAGERAEPAIEDVVEAEQLRELRRPPRGLVDVVETTKERQVCAKRHALVERGLIGDEATSRSDGVRIIPD